MDFIWPDGRSNRDVYEPGPYISSLEDSKMSNHIGINGIIETKDEKFIFVKQYGNNSIGKNTIGTSIGTVLKAEYILKRDGSLVEDAVVKAIQREIIEALEVKDIEIKKENIVAIYRDLVEGGKPQILFYKKINIEQKKVCWKKREKIIFIKKDVVMNGEVKKNGISTNEGDYSMMPSVVASSILIKYYLEKIDLPTEEPSMWHLKNSWHMKTQLQLVLIFNLVLSIAKEASGIWNTALSLIDLLYRDFEWG